MKGFFGPVRNSSICILFFIMALVVVPGSATAVADTMPRFSLAEVPGGRMVDSSSYAGKVKLVVFFATWCLPCMQEVPHLLKLQDEYGGDDFTVVAISVDNRADAVETFVRQRQITYPVLMFNRQVVADFGGIPGLPTTFVVDRNDLVMRKYPGLVPYALLEREVKRLLTDGDKS